MRTTATHSYLSLELNNWHITHWLLFIKAFNHKTFTPSTLTLSHSHIITIRILHSKERGWKKYQRIVYKIIIYFIYYSLTSEIPSLMETLIFLMWECDNVRMWLECVSVITSSHYHIITLSFSTSYPRSIHKQRFCKYIFVLSEEII